MVQVVPEEKRASLRDLLYHDASRNKSYVVKRPRRGVKEALLDYRLLASTPYEGRELSALRVTLHTGDTFQYIRYVNFAVDTNGNRLFDNIELRGTVDTNTAGSYELTYTITSRVTGDRESATLTVVVEG